MSTTLEFKNTLKRQGTQNDRIYLKPIRAQCHICKEQHKKTHVFKTLFGLFCHYKKDHKDERTYEWTAIIDRLEREVLR